MKTCTLCKETKPIDQFFRDKRREGGRMSRCKTCKVKLHNQYRKANNYDAKRYWKNPIAERERHLVKKYGITNSRYEALLNKQSFRCAICQKLPIKNRALDVDHCHKTGVVRGLLCTSCNRMLGHAGDSEEILFSAVDYLRNSSKPTSKQGK